MKTSLLIILFLLSLLPTVEGKVDPKPLKEITADEYKVFTDFFNTEKYTGIDVPQFFDDVYKAREVFEKTFVLEKKDMDSLFTLKKIFGDPISELIKDFQQKNKEQNIIREKIAVKWMKILTEKRQEEALKSEKTLREVPSQKMSEIIYLSRVGFNKAKDAALFYVIHSGSPRTSYYVLMEKTDNKWAIKKTVMDNMIIF